MNFSQWEAVLENVKRRVREPMSGNALKVNKVKEYYLLKHLKAWLASLARPPVKFKPFSYRIDVVLSPSMEGNIGQNCH